MRKGKLLAGVLSAAMVLGSLTLPENISIGGIDFGTLFAHAEEEDAYAETITLYGMNSTYEEALSIPSNYAQSYQIENDDAVSYSVYSGDSVTVSSEGLIEPKYETWYKTGSFSTTAYVEGASTTDKIVTGTSVVKVTTESNYYLIAVTVEDYTDVYLDQVIDEFIVDNITSDMTDLEILDAVCSFPASYDYSSSYSSAKGMVIYGGGDCWASCSLIIETCEKLGITAWVRNGNKDSGAGSGHRNVMVELNDVYYELEAGYSGTAPRLYYVKVRSSLFSTRSVTGGVEVYQYDGQITGEYELEIPEEIDGETVVSIGDSFAVSDSYLTKVTIPDTVTSIGKSAFNSCSSLTELNIPASVSEIDEFAFTNCNNLSNFTCDSDSLYFTIVDGILYDKDMTTVYFAPYVSEIVLPDTVETINEYAIYYCNNLTYIYIPASVTYIGEGGVSSCSSLATIDLEDGGDALEIDSCAFRQNTKVTRVAIPSSITEISSYAFCYCTGLAKIEIPTSVTSIDDYAFEGCNNITDVYFLGTESEWNEITIGSDNACLTSATIHYSTEMPLAQTLSVEIESSSIAFDETTQITASGIGTITYVSSDTSIATVDDNGLVTAVDVGTVTITVTASGDSIYDSDTETISLTVIKKDQVLTVSIESTTIAVYDISQITASAEGTIRYTSSDEDVVYVNHYGRAIAMGVGTATITIKASSTDLYNETQEEITVTVVKTDQKLKASIESGNIVCGDTSNITVSGNGTITYSSSDTSVATVSSDGLVTAVGVGTAIITINASGDENYNAATETVTVTVVEEAAETYTNTDSDSDISTGSGSGGDTSSSLNYILGDINDDGFVDYLDAMLALRYDAELITFTDEQLLAGDVNRDGSVDSLDAILILRYDAGLITRFT